MATNTRKKKTTTSNKVVFEFEEGEDTLQVKLEGLKALKAIQKNLSSLGCCVPFVVACDEARENSADDDG